ncbi:MAG: EAL domain-containing protein [Actinomycetota bacterium]|nr:EAL domain-containing protein [Actinomycetota bacterium]
MNQAVWRVWLALGLALSALYVAAPVTLVTEVLVYIGVGLAAVACVVFGLLRHRPPAWQPWALFAAGNLCFVLGDMVRAYHDWAGVDPFPSLADAARLVGYPLLIAGLASLAGVRRPDGDRASMVDASIIATAVGFGAWLLLVSPYAVHRASTLGAQLVSAAYPLMDVALVGVTVRLALAGGLRNRSYYLLGAAITALLVSDVAYLFAEMGGWYRVGGVLDAGWLVSYVCFGAAALHPSMRALCRPTPGAENRLGPQRLIALMVAALTAPVTLGVQDARGAPVDIPFAVACSVVLFGLVVIRMAGLVDRVEELTQRRGEERFRSLVHHASDVITILDAEGRVSFVSPAAERVWGHDRDEFAAAFPDALVHREDVEQVRRHLAQVADAEPGASVNFDGRIRHRDGSWRNFEAVAANLLEDPNVAGVVVTTRDVTSHKELERQLTHQAFHDSLTGLANRALFLDRVEHAVARRSAGRPAVLFIDLDDFKTVNDSLGHEAGDELLVAVADRLLLCVRAADTAARLGGDEFAVLVDEATSRDAITALARRILDDLCRPSTVQNVSVAMSASIGIAMSVEEKSAQVLLRNADAAMYAAKTRGKGRFELFSSSMHRRAVQRLELKSELAQALEHGALRLDYQPIVDLRTDEVIGAEALLRWDHPTQGLRQPNDFIPLAEETGLIVPIGRWVLRTACRQARGWQDRYPNRHFRISVNVSGVQLRDPGFVDEVARALDDSGLPAASLLIELTESVLMHDADATVATLNRVKALGVRMAVDDFGTGYCSLAYLQNFPVDLLKIDKSFVAELGHGSHQSTVTRSIMQLARELKIAAVAEGVEDPRQLTDLLGLDCDLGQGFHFARPMGAAEFDAVLADQPRHRTARAGSPANPAS